MHEYKPSDIEVSITKVARALIPTDNARLPEVVFMLTQDQLDAAKRSSSYAKESTLLKNNLYPVVRIIRKN